MYKILIKENTTSQSILCNILNKDITEDDLVYNEYGKPYLKDNSIYFNISHKDNITVCVISDKEIGVDIEKITFKEHILPKICSLKELDTIHNAEDFTILWTKKESYVKYLGIGLSYGLKNVIVKNHKYSIQKYKDYYITICFG